VCHLMCFMCEDFPAVSAVHQNFVGQVHTHFGSCYIQNRLPQNVPCILPQPHNSTVDTAKNKFVLLKTYLLYKISNELDVELLARLCTPEFNRRSVDSYQLHNFPMPP
jgi:hypothetical protein